MMFHGKAIEETGLENPLAVYIRNVPILLLTDEKFNNLIANWRGVDKNNSSYFFNKKNTSWNGWAIVYFVSENDRKNFLEDENQHYIRDTVGTVHKLKVTKWFEKSTIVAPKPVSTGRPIPYYKADLFVNRRPYLEDFERKCNESSIQSFRGIIKSYLTNKDGLGHNGFIQINLIHQDRDLSETILFHSNSCWLCQIHDKCSVNGDCVKKCQVDDHLPSRLKVGSEVYFTARKIPQGILDSCRFQAKSIWQGESSQPNYVSPPSSLTLDGYLKDYLQQIEGKTRESEKDQSPSSLEGPGRNSPIVVTAVRRKPLQGSLRQLNSTLDKDLSLKVQKKIPPSNFAQAVAAPSTVKVAEAADFLEKGKVESFPTPDEVVVSVHGYGKFILGKHHFEGSIKDLRTSLKNDSSLVVALSLDKSGGKSSKYVVVKAFPEAQVSQSNNNNNSGKNGFGEDCPSSSDCNESVVSKGESNHDINLEDLDKYYDTFPKISEYLKEEIPRVIPSISKTSSIIDLLTNEIIYSGADYNETAILDRFFSTHKTPPQTKTQFIVNYVRFRNSQFSLENEYTEEFKSTDCSVEKDDFDPEVNDFLSWVENRDVQYPLKLALYREFFSFPSFRRIWLNVVKDSERIRYASFISEKNTCHPEFVQLQNRILSKGDIDWPGFEGWIEADTHQYKARLYGGEPEKSSTGVTQGEDRNIFASLKLSELEMDFVRSKEKDGETSTFILRAVLFLRKSGFTFNDLIDMHQEHLSLSSKPRNRDFNSKLQSILGKKVDQKLLDDTNALIKNNKDLKVKENIRMSCKKIDKYIPVIVNSLCGFLFEKSNISKRNGSMDKSPTRSVKRYSVPPSKDEFESLKLFLEGKDEGHNFEGIVQTLGNRNLDLNALAKIFNSCKDGGIFKWNLEVSKLQLNPPVGITIFKVGESLWSYFNSDESRIVQPQPNLPDTDVPTSLRNSSQTHASSEIRSLLAKARTEELTSALLEGSDVMVNLSTQWKEYSLTEEDKVAELAAVVWNQNDVNTENIENDISEFYNRHAFDEMCVKPLKSLLSSWAEMLEKSTLFKVNILSVYNLLKLTLASFDPNIYEEIQEGTCFVYDKVFTDLVCGKDLYACEGIVTEKNGSFLCIQTKHCQVLAHSAVVFSSSSESTTNPEDCCLDLFSLVRVHSVPIPCTGGDGGGAAMCHIALLVWEVCPEEAGALLVEPPGRGILLPLEQPVYNRIKKLSVEFFQDNGNPADFEFGNQSEKFDELWFAEDRFENPADWKKDRKEAQTVAVLVSYGHLKLDFLKKKILSTFSKHYPSAFINHGEFVERFVEHLYDSAEVASLMTSYKNTLQEHGETHVLEKFLEKHPSYWFRPEKPITNVSSRNTVPGSDSNRKAVYEETPVVDAASSEEDFQLSVHLNTLFQLLQETNAAVTSIDKRVQALEKMQSVNGKDESSYKPTERSYVKIWREEEGEIEEVPTNQNGLLPLSTVRALYEGTSGLKFRVPGAQRTWRSLLLEQGLFHPPEDGWGERVYLASLPAGTNHNFPGNNNLLGSQLPVGASNRSGLNNPALSSLSQLLVRQPSASIWGSSPNPILGGISPVNLDFQDPSNPYQLT